MRTSTTYEWTVPCQEDDTVRLFDFLGEEIGVQINSSEPGCTASATVFYGYAPYYVVRSNQHAVSYMAFIHPEGMEHGQAHGHTFELDDDGLRALQNQLDLYGMPRTVYMAAESAIREHMSQISLPAS